MSRNQHLHRAGSLVGAMLGLLAFILAFTFGMTASRFDARKQLVQENRDSELRSLFISGLNEVIDLHESRKTVALVHRIPGVLWLSVYLLSILSILAIGYQIGMAGSRRMHGMLLLVAAFSLLIVMIADMDRPGEGQFQASLQSLEDVQRMMLQDAP